MRRLRQAETALCRNLLIRHPLLAVFLHQSGSLARDLPPFLGRILRSEADLADSTQFAELVVDRATGHSGTIRDFLDQYALIVLPRGGSRSGSASCSPGNLPRDASSTSLND